MVKVSVMRCDSYSDAYSAIADCLRPLGGMASFVKKGDKILLKVNLLIAKSKEHAVTTHPEIVRAVLQQVRESGGIPSVGDSPAFQSAAHAAEKSGIKKVCDEMKVPIIELKTLGTVKSDGRVSKTLKLAKELKDFDGIINLPKLKTHQLAGYTGAVKNLYGCVPGRTKSMYHLRLQGAIPFTKLLLDISDIIKPRINIMDAVIGMDGKGPGAGDPKQIGAVIASKDAMALDAVATDMVGMKPSEVTTIRLAQKEGMKSSFLDNVEKIGPDIHITDFRRSKSVMSHLPHFVPGLVKNMFTERPYVIEEDCISCRGCGHVCPAGAITYPGKYPVFDYKKCIRCYCCHEVCPKKAIHLKGGLMAKAASKLLGAQG